MAFIDLMGLRCHVQQLDPQDAGPPATTAVLVHGLLTDSLASFYFGLGPALSRAGVRVLMYDHRGHGRSDRPASGYHLERFVDDLECLLDRLKVTGPIHLLGNCFGGTAAFELAARRPDQVAGLFVIESELAGRAWAAKMDKLLRLAETQLPQQDALEWIAAHFGTRTAHLARQAGGLITDTSLVQDLPASRLLPEAERHAIRCPVLAVYGTESELAAQAPQLERALPDCQSALVPGQKHSVLVSAPQMVRELALSWLREQGVGLRGPAAQRHPLPKGGPSGQPEGRPMSRFLFVVPPLVGHVNPLVGVAAELSARGHATAWAGLPKLVHGLAGPKAKVFECVFTALGSNAEVLQRPPELRGVAALKFLWEAFLHPLAKAMAPGVEAAVQRFRPDVLVVDQQTVAGALVAERLGLPWATSATTSAEFTDALEAVPLVASWITGLLNDLRGRIGDPAGTADPRFSPHLILAFTTPELAGPAAVPSSSIRFVGPSIAARPTAPSFPWDWLDPSRRLVLVTLGTTNLDAGPAFLTACRTALKARADRLQAVLVDRGGVLEAAAPDPDILVLPSVPQLELLTRTDAVVCHAGHNTVCEALWHGVPLVVAPIRDDQPVVAEQVATARAGVRVRFGRTTAARLGQAVDAVLDDPAYRAAAERIGASFRAAGGASAAATHLERLASHRQSTPGRTR